MTISNNTYDVLKKICLMFGYIVTFVAALTEIWGFPWGAEAAATIAAFGALLGACLEVASKTYHREQEKKDE